MHAALAERRHQALELGKRKMRRAQRDPGQRQRRIRAEFDTRLAQLGKADVDDLLRLPVVKSLFQGPGLGRDADSVKQRNAAGRTRCRADRFQVVLAAARQQARDRRNPMSALASHEMSEQVIKQVAVSNRPRQAADIEQNLRRPVFIAMQPGKRHAPGDRGANVEIVAVLVGARADHRVVKTDRVRFGTDDVIAEPGPVGQLVGCAGPHRITSQFDVGPHQFTRFVHLPAGERIAHGQVV